METPKVPSGLTQLELKSLLNLLAAPQRSVNESKLFLDFMNQDISLPLTRSRYIQEMTQILNKLNLPTDKNLRKLETDHFHSIVDGLTLISDNKNVDLTSLSSADLSTLIRNITSEAELINLFEWCTVAGKVTPKIAIEILLNKELVSVEHYMRRLLGNRSNKWTKKDYNDLEFAMLQKQYQLKQFEKLNAQLRNVANDEYWIYAMQNNQVSLFSQRTFWKFSLLFRDLETNFKLLDKFQNSQVTWVFLESFQYYIKMIKDQDPSLFQSILKHLQHNKFSKDQAVLFEFLRHELIASSLEEIHKILHISLVSRAAVLELCKKQVIVKELTKNLLYLQQRYQDFDLTSLNETLQTYSNSKVEDPSSNGVLEIGKLFF